MPPDYITDNNVSKFYFIPETENEVSNKVIDRERLKMVQLDGMVPKHLLLNRSKRSLSYPLSIYVIIHSWQVFFMMNWKLQMWSPFLNLEIWFSQTIGLYQSYQYFPNRWKGSYIIASSNLSVMTNYYMIISSGFKEVNLPSLLIWCWLTKSLKLWITRNVSLVYSWIFQKHSIMKFYYLNWRNMAYKGQSYNG